MKYLKLAFISLSIALISTLVLPKQSIKAEEVEKWPNCWDLRTRKDLNRDEIITLNQRGWKGLPFAFADWEEIMWGMPKEEFRSRFNKYLRQCRSPRSWSFYDGKDWDEVSIETDDTILTFYFERRNAQSQKTLSSIKIESTYANNFFHELWIRYGNQQNPSRSCGVNLYNGQIYCNTPANGGTWVLPQTTVRESKGGDMILHSNSLTKSDLINRNKIPDPATIK
jgi:hypothetical protein